MSRVDDVAAYVLEEQGQITVMKLQKLVYYSQAWHLVWDSEPLFEDPILAWANGPVIRRLYDQHRGRFQVSEWPSGASSNLTQDQRETIDAVLGLYGELTAVQLSELTHSEDPWRDARAGLEPGERSEKVIAISALAEYYEGLVNTGIDTRQ